MLNIIQRLKVIDIFQCSRRPATLLAVVAIVMAAQFALAPGFAQPLEKRTIPSAKRLGQALSVIEQTSRYGVSPIPEKDRSFSWKLVKYIFQTRDPKTKWQKPEQETFYDRKGRLRNWVVDASAPGGRRVLESPPMEELRKLSKGWVDWGFESDYVGTSLTNTRITSSKPVLDQSYNERKNSKMRFSTKMGLSLNLPNPVEIDKEYYLRGKIIGKAPYPVTVRFWVDGEEKTFNEGNYGDQSFFMPIKFATAGNHSLKVETVDGDGKKRTRFINFPVSFAMSVESKPSYIDGDQVAVGVTIKGSNGPFNVTLLTDDGQRVEKDNQTLRKLGPGKKLWEPMFIRVPNPGQNSVKWIDVFVRDTEAQNTVSRRIRLDDMPVETSFTASKTTLAPGEKTTLSVNIKGGEPYFRLVLFVDGKSKQGKVAKDRKGQFSIKFDEPGTYSVYVTVGSKTIAGKKVTSTTRPVVLTVSEPEEETVAEENSIGILTGAVEPFNVSRTGYKWLGLPGGMNGTVTISIAGSTASAKITYEANDLIYTDFTGVASGEISGYLTRQGKLVLAGRIPFRANDLSGCERTNSSGDQRTCQGTVVVWIKGQRVGNRLEGSWQFDRKHNGKWQTSPISEVFLTPNEVEAFDDETAKSVRKFKADVANSNEYELFKDALLEYFE